ncbi:hypothetical protein A4R43_32940 [Amycolatopsis albispora]|uniref:Uncharacterized protein n=2 Tax=Amycolatopsis albispora TaxID=1804986 RepID=A0A344LLS6_9PSEU|nr:hypothetical protein A4R43_32940 [Amycolatopsis albispora]
MPQPVKASWYLWIAASVVMVLGFVLSLALKQQIIDLTLDLPRDPRLTAEQVAGGITTVLWTFLVGAIVFAALFLLFAWKAKDGTRSARTVLTVLAVVTVVFQVLFFTNEAKLLACALIIAATVCLYLPSARPYFPKLPKR